MIDDNTHARLDLIDERLDHYRDRIEAIEGSLTVEESAHLAKKSHFWEILIGVLVAIEALFEIALYFKDH